MDVPLKKAIETIVRTTSPEQIILFGSHAKGNSKSGSDYDLLVLKKGIRNPRNYSQKIYLHLKNIGAPLDIIVASLNNYEKRKTDPYSIYFEAASHGKVIYEKN